MLLSIKVAKGIGHHCASNVRVAYDPCGAVMMVTSWPYHHDSDIDAGSGLLGRELSRVCSRRSDFTIIIIIIIIITVVLQRRLSHWIPYMGYCGHVCTYLSIAYLSIAYLSIAYLSITFLSLAYLSMAY